MTMVVMQKSWIFKILGFQKEPQRDVPSSETQLVFKAAGASLGL